MRLKEYLSDRFNRLEIIFFFIYYFLFPVLGNLEFNLLEFGKLSLALNDLTGRLISLTLAFLPALLCYKVLIQGFLFKKKYLKFFAGFVVYLLALNFYILYKYYAISRMSFLSPEIVEEALKSYNAHTLIHFSVLYMLRDLFVLAALAYFIRSAKLDKQIVLLGKQQLEAELGYLKMQIQPHFFFNTLNNIYALTLQHSDLAAPLVAKYAEMMRYILYNSSSQATSLQQEIEFLKNYTEVESVRYHDKISINFEAQGINATAMIAPLLLLPFIENTFKHGISEATGKGFIFIILSQVGDELSAEISNSKPELVRSGKTTSGIGLLNVRKRLKMLYPNKHTLIIKEDENSYTVSLTIKL